MAIRQEGNTYYGLSTDAKPTGAVLNGREFREMDTGKKYLFDAENGEWLEQPEEGGGGGGGSSTLSGLTDVDISNPTDGQTLVYNSTSGKWANGGGPLIIHVNDQGVLDKTWQEIHDCAPLVWVEGSDGGNPAFLPLKVIGTHSGNYFCMFQSLLSDTELITAATNTPNGYPVFVDA